MSSLFILVLLDQIFFDREGNFLVLWIELDHFRSDFFAFRDNVFDFTKRLVRELSDVDQSFDAIVQFDKGAESGDFCDRSVEPECQQA